MISFFSLRTSSEMLEVRQKFVFDFTFSLRISVILCHWQRKTFRCGNLSQSKLSCAYLNCSLTYFFSGFGPVQGEPSTR